MTVENDLHALTYQLNGLGMPRGLLIQGWHYVQIIYVLPSGKLTVCDIENGPVEIMNKKKITHSEHGVDFPFHRFLETFTRSGTIWLFNIAMENHHF